MATADNVNTQSDSPAMVGKLMEHGEAPYKNNRDNNMSYYVKLEMDKGEEQTTWGVGLREGLKESEAATGDRVTLEQTGSKAVSVKRPKKDEAGNVVGEETIESHRNAWRVTKGEKKTEAEAESESDDVVNTIEMLAKRTVSASIDNPKNERREPKETPEGAPVELPGTLNNKYTRDGNRFVDRDGNMRFTATETKIKGTDRKNDSARDMAAVAEHMGWSEVQLSGSKDFRREAWVEATARGIQAHNYQPNREDRDRLMARKRQIAETREAGAARDEAQHDIAPASSASKPSEEMQARLEAIESLSPSKLYKQYPDMKREAAVISAAQTFAKEKIGDKDSRAEFNSAIRSEIAGRVADGRAMKDVKMKGIEAPQQQQESGAER